MKHLFYLLILFMVITSCNKKPTREKAAKENVRQLTDTIGFAQYPWQMDSIFSRMNSSDTIKTTLTYKAVICPHDDYAYAAGLYAKTLSGIKANTIILVGVAHKAKKYELKDKLILGDFTQWKSVYGNVKISAIRNQLIDELPQEDFIVHDSMMQTEHSLEAIVPFLQKQHENVEIIPVLVPYNTFENMERYAADFSKVLYKIMKENKLTYGKDIAVVISNDAIHYGNKDWGGNNLAPFGTDSIGSEKALQKDQKIIAECLTDSISPDKIQLFNEYTVQPDNYMQYQWTWCGRYAVPFGLMMANNLNELLYKQSLNGHLIDYRSSLKDKHINTSDIGMGVTAPAKTTHWVAYTGISYE
ncbi:AmmeMemoRadiSam system protein B [Zhouia sp. PK063]|uniref:AmmeMemoRadiSam system protein B n=1 Tax=Zhouia sp. PK063 TaxID=3373602 RepID=UPI0037BD0DA9